MNASDDMIRWHSWAENGFYVVLPDIFQGDAVPLEVGWNPDGMYA
jgi:hypothetical protein